jgi:AraC-like DNA-binding protein/mannose-6-phosphate isomerase-like protein (cupin superfamily)
MTSKIARTSGRPTNPAARHLDRPCAPENARLAAAVSGLGPLWMGDITIRTEILHLTCPPPRHAAGEHLHPFLEVTYVQRGAMDYFREGRRIPVRRGEIFCMPPGAPHSWANRAKPSVLFGFMLSVSPASNRTDSLAFRMSEAANGLGYRIRPAADLSRVFEAVRAEVRRERSCQEEIVAGYVRLILMLVFRHLGDYLGLRVGRRRETPPDSRAEQLFLQAQAFIQANIAYGVSLADVARHLGITGRHLNRIFRERGEDSVGETIAATRVEKAGQLLRSGRDLAVKEIAALCGFGDVSYFCRFFRERTGRTPKEFAVEVPE